MRPATIYKKSFDFSRLVTTILLILTSLVFTQAKAIKDSLIAIQHLEAAKKALAEGQEKSFEDSREKALLIFKDRNDICNWIKVHKEIGKVYRGELGLPNKALESFAKATIDNLWRKPNTSKEWDEMGWLHVNIAFVYTFSLGRIKEAANHYEIAKSYITEKAGIEDLLVADYIYRELGNIYTRQGEFDAAELMLNKFKDISLEDENYAYAAEACSDLGLLYIAKGEQNKAISVYREGLAYPNLSYAARGLLYINLSKAYKVNGQHDEAMRFAELSIQELEKINDPEYLKSKAWIGGAISEIAMIHAHRKNFSLAEEKLKESMAYFKAAYRSRNRREFGKQYLVFSDLYIQWGKYQKALESHQKALQCILPSFQPKTVYDNPAPDKFFAENTIMEALAGKALAFHKRYKKDDGQEDLLAALKCHELLFDIEKKIRRSYRYESSKLFNLEESRERNENAIEIALELWELTKDEQYKEKAFGFAERSKSILLLEAFRKTKAEHFAGIPAQVQEREKELQAAISLAEKHLFSANDAGEEEAAKEIETKLLGLRQEYTDWMYQIEEQYPQYYNLKYNFESITVEEVQQQLSVEEEALIAYFTGNNNIYAFVITTGQFEVVTISKNFPLEEWVVQLRRDIEQFQLNGVDRSMLAASYGEKAYALYRKLLYPLESFNLPKRLLIIPSGVMGYLPFDALLTAPAPGGYDFRKYPYLINRHSIHYGYSATLHSDLRQRQSINRRFAGFAPAFSGDGGFASLEHNTESLQQAGSLFKSTLFLDQQASLDNFLKESQNYGLLQLASHAEANTEAGDFSFIVFSDGAGGYDSLFVQDLYLLELQAELVVLSACETGVGLLHKGEGIISLARGFLYSGTRSILTSLWSINENTNLAITEQFYQFLKEGLSKDEALRAAKLAHLEQSGKMYAHPVYWAAMSPIGNMDPVFHKSYWWLAFPALVILTAIFFLLRRKERVILQNVDHTDRTPEPERSQSF